MMMGYGLAYNWLGRHTSQIEPEIKLRNTDQCGEATTRPCQINRVSVN